MSVDASTKPYLIRAIHEWCNDNNYTAYISVKVDEHTLVPMEFVKDGQIVLNASYAATRNLTINNELVQFSARFSGVSREVRIPIPAILGIFAKENGHGIFFEVKTEATAPAAQSGSKSSNQPPAKPKSGKPDLKIIK